MLGAGAVGGVVTARLAGSGQHVVVVARGPHLEAIRRDGLTLATPERRSTCEVAVVPSPRAIDWQDGDVVLLAVKCQDTYPALSDLVQVAPPTTPVVCLQNGVANEPAALRWFENVYGVVVMLPATHLEPGVVAQHSSPVPGLLDIGRWPSGADSLCARLADLFGEAGFDARVLDDVSRWKYAKLLANLSNVVGALCGPHERHGRITELAREEGRCCLDAADIAFASVEEDRDRRGDLLQVQAAVGQPRQGSSSWQSLARATGTIETDFLNGEIVRIGRLHAVPTPVNSLLQQLARQHAHQRRPPGSVSCAELLDQLEREA